MISMFSQGVDDVVVTCCIACQAESFNVEVILFIASFIYLLTYLLSAFLSSVVGVFQSLQLQFGRGALR